MLAIIIPYRNREQHLKTLLCYLNNILDLNYIIVVVEQADEKPFNRGKLLNVGFLETRPDYFLAHDVDMLLDPQAYHVSPDFTTQLCASDVQLRDYLGGVTLFKSHAFAIAGGYHNEFFHRAEDNEMSFNLKRKGIPVRLEYFKYINLPHPRTGPEFIPELWQKAQAPRNINMLENCQYEVISNEVHDTHTHLRVLL